MCSKLGTIILTLLVAIGVASAVKRWPVASDDATHTNQGRKIMRSSSNHCLHLIFEHSNSGSLVYTRSTNGGTNWSALEVAANDWYDEVSSLALNDSSPWVATAIPVDFIPPKEGLKGIVRSGSGTWTGVEITDIGSDRIYSTSTVMSPSDVADPMAYTVFADAYDDNPTHYRITFVAWILQSGTPASAYSAEIDNAALGDSVTFDPEASIAVSSCGGYDTIHIAYHLYASGANQVFYVKSTNAVNPDLIRASTYPTWSSPTRLSTGTNHEPATQPSIEFTSSNSRLAVVWRGPNSSGTNTGEVYEITRVLNGSWGSISNMTNTSTKESDQPETVSSDWGLVYEEQATANNWEVYLKISSVVNMSSSSTNSRYPHAARSADTVYVIWTEAFANCDSVCYDKYRWIPDKFDGEGHLAELAPEPAAQVCCSPNPFVQVATLSYELPFTQNVQLSIYGLNGRLVKELVGEEQSSGRYAVTWHRDDRLGRMVPEGVYICRLSLQGTAVASEAIVAE